MIWKILAKKKENTELKYWGVARGSLKIIEADIWSPCGQYLTTNKGEGNEKGRNYF